MSIINTYREKELELQKVQKQLEELKAKPELKEELAFKEAIEEVLNRFNKTAADLASTFALEGSAAESNNGKARRKRTPTVYRDPDGNEIVVRGGRQKNYQDWIKKYGKETVQSWKVTN